jgi:glutaconate CoA-transferase subunit A
MTTFITLDEAVHHITNNMVLAVGGMTLYRRPMAFVRALLNKSPRPRQLTLLSFTMGLECDLLVGAGCVDVVRTCYFGLSEFGLAPMFTQFAQSGRVRVIEETEASLVCGIKAQTAGVSFMPSTAWLGTDLPRLRPDVKAVIDPYTGESLTAFPAIPIDVAVIHALEADRLGNVTINQNLGIDLELVYCAKTVIVTVEKMIDHCQKSADRVVIPSAGVDFIALAPHGAYPTSCYPAYPMDGLALMDYVEMCNGGRFADYLCKFLNGA